MEGSDLNPKESLAQGWQMFSCCILTFDLKNGLLVRLISVCYWNYLKENLVLQWSDNFRIYIWGREHEVRELKMSRGINAAKLISIFAEDWKRCVGLMGQFLRLVLSFQKFQNRCRCQVWIPSLVIIRILFLFYLCFYGRSLGEMWPEWRLLLFVFPPPQILFSQSGKYLDTGKKTFLILIYIF